MSQRLYHKQALNRSSLVGVHALNNKVKQFEINLSHFIPLVSFGLVLHKSAESVISWYAPLE
jgi:hypothetical protein